MAMSVKIKERRRARMHAIQALYQQQMAGSTLTELKQQYHEDNVNRHSVDWLFFNELLEGVDEHTAHIDETIKPLVDRNFDSINPIELSILRLGIFELLYRLDVPHQVVINEYVSYAFDLGAEDGYKFVNGLLEKATDSCRTV